MIYVAEVNNYRLIEKYDVQLMDNFLTTFAESGLDDQTTLLLFNTELIYPDIVQAGGIHRLENVTSSNWAFQGMANSESDRFRFRAIEPIRANLDIVQPQWLNDAHGFFGIADDLSVVHLELRPDNQLYLWGTDVLFGRVELYEGNYFFMK